MMQRTPGLILFCLLIHAATDNEQLICPKSQVEAAVGENVTLECHVDPERDVTAELFKLKFNQADSVLVYKGDGVMNSPDDQAEQFKGRASLESNSENLSKGKFAVNISSVTTADAGTYTCTVGKGSRPFHCIDLIIDPKENSIKGNQTDNGEPKENSIKGNQIDGVSKNNSDQDPGPTPKRGDHNNTCIIVSVIGIVVVVGIVVAVVLWRRRTSQTEENNQNDEGTDSNAVERIPLRTLAVSNE